MKLTHAILLAVFFCFLNNGIAQIPDIVKKEIQYRIKNQINPSIAVGVYDSTGTHYYVHGHSDMEKQIKANENTIYEIGSITKTYTGLLLAKYAIEDSLDINTPANYFLPDSIRLTDRNGTDVTLRNLATHSAGLPRLPSNMDINNQLDPYATYNRNKMFSFLSHYIPRTVDKEFVYSNLGFGLLGEILSMYKNEPYATLLNKELLKPLALTHTYLKVPEDKKQYLAKGYLGSQEVPHWHFESFEAAGGLKCTVKDLVKYGKSYLEGNNATFKKADSLVGSTQFKDRQGNLHGLGWFINSNGILFHGGGTGGFRTFVAIDRKEKRVIAIMTNSGSSPAEDIAEYLIDPKENPLDIANEEIEISSEELMEYAGTYINDGLNLKYEIVLLEDHLQAQLNQQPEFPLFYQGESTFIYKVVKAKVVFERDENNTIVGLLLYQNGQEIQFIKTNP